MFKPGAIINKRYIIKGKIGEGGMSKVYSAYDTVRNDTAALKCSFRGMPLAREYHIMKSADCTGIPRVFELFEFEGVSVMALEYIDGYTLSEAAEHGRRKDKTYFYVELMRKMINICMTADYLHREKGILYLDFKPSNVIMGRKGTFLIDFGAAADLKDIRKGAGIALYGTEKYAAPEQKAAGRVIDVRTDIYQIGGLIRYIIGISGVRDRAVAGIAKRCMDRRMCARYSSAKEVAALLAGCVKYNGQIYVKSYQTMV